MCGQFLPALITTSRTPLRQRRRVKDGHSGCVFRVVGVESVRLGWWTSRHMEA